MSHGIKQLLRKRLTTSHAISLDYSPEFDAAWLVYPKRPGNSKSTAFRAWQARVREGQDPAQLTAGVLAYAAYCKAQGTDPKYIKLAATFFGPGQHFLCDWTVDDEPRPNGKNAYLFTPEPEWIE